MIKKILCSIHRSLALCLLMTSCSTKSSKIESLTFDPLAPKKANSVLLEKATKEPQDQLIKKIILTSASDLKQKPRTQLVANRLSPVTGFEKIAPQPQINQDSEVLSKEFVIYTVQNAETPKFIAEHLLGSRENFKKITQVNPGLVNKPLAIGQQIRIAIKDLKPDLKFLTKDFVLQYRDVLYSKYVVNHKSLKKYKVEHLDTLQSISIKLYSDENRWIELYIINMKSLAHPDQIEKGSEILYN